MHDIKKIRVDVDTYINKISRRNGDFSDILTAVKLDKERREYTANVEILKANRNSVSKEVGKIKRDGGDASKVLYEMDSIGEEIKSLDEKVSNLSDKIVEILEVIPNIPHDTVPDGKTEEENVLIREWGNIEKRKKMPHWEIATNLDIIDFERSSKITGSRSSVFKGMGARLERALINFLMDVHTLEHNYTEIATPYIVNRDSMYATGQLPKFENDAYLTKEGKHFLIPTTEVPLINLHRDEVIDNEELTKSYVAYSANFRKEAGSAGKDTKGILRQHQFKKVELVKFTRPEDSYEELEKLTSNAEMILQKLNIPYRVVSLCAGDLGFGASKTYDIEAWMPESGGYREISSCSNCEDFQSRRANIKFKRDKKSKVEFVHTLNGTGVAIGRLMIAIIENYQNEDGSITVPDALVPYMNGITKIV